MSKTLPVRAGALSRTGLDRGSPLVLVPKIRPSYALKGTKFPPTLDMQTLERH